MSGAAAADSSTTPLRRVVYALLLTLFAFIQKPGLMVADTKFDLMVDPGRFLSRATEMWDGEAAFGQIQNQAYGYLFPMGPFFWLGEHLGLDAWVTQRLWWSTLLLLAFFGLLKVAETLQIGKPWTRVVAAFAYALSVHITTIIGASSVEAWPTALVPWVLWALMRATDGGSERRWAAAAGLFTVLCGGVNAVAVAVVLPLGAAWILTRERGTRRWVVFGWWVGTTLLATLWWLIPLFLMGGYSFPFLDYIENASVTTAPTGLVDVMTGSSVWVPFVDPATYGAGKQLALTPFLIVDAALLAALGVAGLARRDVPHRQFLLTGLLVGVALLSFGYTGDGSGWGAGFRQDLLDGALAPLRNLHKFDAVLRLPLVLGLAHVLGVMMPSWSRASWSVRLWPGVAMIALAGVASPWFLPAIAPAGPVETVPDYWTKTARYLNAQDDRGRTLVVPASGFGTYQWGTPRDDVLQPLMDSDWGVRNVVPLAEPGNVAFLDAVTEELESGRPSPRLAEVLRSNGISRVVVRNDLDRSGSGAPDPVVVHQALDRSPGLRPAASFGPSLGWAPWLDVEGDRVVPFGGLTDSYDAVEVYDVLDAPGVVTTVAGDDVPVVAGGAGASLVSAMVPGSFLLAADAEERPDDLVLTDTMRRREKAFAAVRDNESATMPTDAPWRLTGREHFHRTSPDQERWQAVTAWRGVRRVTASSSQAWADAVTPLDRGEHPGAALDSDPGSQWRTARGSDAVGQWWQVDLLDETSVDELELTVGEDSPATKLRISNGTTHVDVDVEDPGESQRVSTGLGESRFVRISVLEVVNGADFAQFELRDVDIPGVDAQRYLRLRGKHGGAGISGISLNRDSDSSGCFTTSGTQVCQDYWVDRGEDGDVIARQFELPAARDYDLLVAGSLRTGSDAVEAIAGELPFSIETSSALSTDVRASGLALVDDDTKTTWVSRATDERPEILVDLERPQTVGSIRLETANAAPASRPSRVSVSGGGESRVVKLDEAGRARFAPLDARRLTLRILDSEPAYDTTVGEETRLPIGASELAVSPPGSKKNLLDAADQEITLPCGEGPGIEVNGTRTGTRVETTLTDLMADKASFTACGSSIGLGQGDNTVLTDPAAAFRLDHVDLYLAGSASPGVEREVPTVRTWTNQERVLDVVGSDQRRLLIVAENFNPGWEASLDGEVLEPQRVGGWQQGWWLPSGSAGEVQLTFKPQSTFVAGLVAGGVALLALLALGLVPARRSRGRASVSRESTAPLAWFVLVPVAGLVAGWAGFAVALIGYAVHRLTRDVDRSSAPGLVCAVLVTSAGLWAAWERSGTEQLTTSAVTQLLVVLAFVVATLGVGAKGPESLKRNSGRSTT